jgi:Caspase domain
MESYVWRAENTYIIAFGLLEWSSSERFGAFSKKDRLDQKIVDFFSKNGVPFSQTYYLQDQESTYSRMEETILQVSAQLKKGDFVFFYYCGHGFFHSKSQEICFAAYDVDSDNEISVQSLIAPILEKKNIVAVFCADCCHSGILTDLCKAKNSENFASFASVESDNSSTGWWTFSIGLLDLLEGNAYTKFVNKEDDCSSTLKDAEDYLTREMAHVDGQRASFYIPGNLKNLLIHTFESKTKHPRIGESVYVLHNELLYMAKIVDHNGQLFQVRFYSYISDSIDWVSEDKMHPLEYPHFEIGEQVEVLAPYKSAWLVKEWQEAQIVENYQNILYKVRATLQNKIFWSKGDYIRKTFNSKGLTS